MLVKNAYIENDSELKDIRIKDGVFQQIGRLTPEENEEVIDLDGKLVLPPFVESHVHLDTCLTAGEPKWNMSGTLFEGIETWSLRKENLSPEDIAERVKKAVRLYAQNGIQYIRTH
ncbi:MAG: amidohydrolase family protein, partial [Erysipelotrichaceae bacterium]|nr:amidohydrolase family protein [Erysipelotrichaceae bacterium]